VEGVDRELRDRARPERFDVVAVGLALDDRAFAEPASGRDAGERDRHTHRRVVAHLQQAVDHAEPVGDRPADPAQELAHLDLHHLQVGQGPLALVRQQRWEPRHLGQLRRLGRARAGKQVGGGRKARHAAIVLATA
jgi:hypothetical protein